MKELKSLSRVILVHVHLTVSVSHSSGKLDTISTIGIVESNDVERDHS